MNNDEKMVQIAINKSLLREYTVNNTRTVYLDNNSEFQLQFFNPHSYTISADIYLNGDRISNSLVIRPGERIWLDRYLDINKKFKFTTYEVDGESETVEKAIAKNGEVKVIFHKEKPRARSYNPYAITISSDAVLNNRDYLYTSLDSISTCYYSDANISSSGCLGIQGDAGEPGIALSSYEIPLETGRVGEGGISDQKLQDVNMDFESWQCDSETIKILPISQKPINSADLQKIYCTGCGHKIKQNYKYCPYCGTKIE